MQSNAVLCVSLSVLMSYFTEASRQDCRAPVTAEGDKAVMTFFVRPEISMSTAPFYLYVKRGDDTDTLQCERSSSLINITCRVNNALVQSEGIINNSLTIVFTNVTQGMQGHYKMHVHFNGSWSIQGCNLTVKGLRDAEIDVKDSSYTTVIAVIVSLLLLVVITIVAVGIFCYFRRKRNKKKDHPEEEQSNKTSPEESAVRLLDEIENMPWYFGNISREEGERLLMLPQNKNRSFLIRLSEMDSGCYALSVRKDDNVKHLLIHQKTDRSGLYLEGDRCTFPTLPELVQHYSKKNIISEPCQREELP